MGALLGAVALVVLLAAIVTAFAWQGLRRQSDESPVYDLDAAAAFVHARLEPQTAQRVTPSQVRRVLEWQIEWQQVVAPRLGIRAVAGSGDAIEHILERAAERDDVIEAADVAEIVAADVEYLMAIHAIGTPVAEGEQ